MERVRFSVLEITRESLNNQCCLAGEWFRGENAHREFLGLGPPLRCQPLASEGSDLRLTMVGADMRQFS